MVLTADRAEQLSKFLVEDKERAYRLLEMEAEEATAEINSNGFDFNAEEVQEFGKQMAMLLNQGDELSEESLDAVSGGIVVEAAVLTACVTLFVAGFSGAVAIGVAIANKKGW